MASQAAWLEAEALILGSFPHADETAVKVLSRLVEGQIPEATDADVDAVAIAICTEEGRVFPPTPGEFVAALRHRLARQRAKAEYAEILRANPGLAEDLRADEEGTRETLALPAGSGVPMPDDFPLPSIVGVPSAKRGGGVATIGGEEAHGHEAEGEGVPDVQGSGEADPAGPGPGGADG
jgi:hypothetical protein